MMVNNKFNIMKDLDPSEKQNGFKQKIFKYLKGNFGGLLNFISFLLSLTSFTIYIIYSYNINVEYFFRVGDWFVILFYTFEYIL